MAVWDRQWKYACVVYFKAFEWDVESIRETYFLPHFASNAGFLLARNCTANTNQEITLLL